MTLCKAASRECNQIPTEKPVNKLIFYKDVKSKPATSKSTPSQVFFKDFGERFSEHPSRLLRNISLPAKMKIYTLKKAKGLEKALNQRLFVWQKATSKKAVNVFHVLSSFATNLAKSSILVNP